MAGHMAFDYALVNILYSPTAYTCVPARLGGHIAFRRYELHMQKPVHRRGESSETYFSAIEHQAETESWISRAHGHGGRPQCDPPPPAEGSETAQRVKCEGDEPVVPGQNKFPRRERLTKQSEYLDVYRNGEKQVGRAFICYAVRRHGQGRKLGIAVSRKIGKAVVRNRLKRYVRETFRTHRMALAEDAHIVFVARPAAVALDYAECEQAMRELLRKGGLLSG